MIIIFVYPYKKSNLLGILMTRNRKEKIINNNDNITVSLPILIRQIGEHHWEPAEIASLFFGRPVIASIFWGVIPDGTATVFIAYPDGTRSTERVPTTICNGKNCIPKTIEQLCVPMNEVRDYLQSIHE